jgi:hypothetical protein
MVHNDPTRPRYQQTNFTGKHNLTNRERLARKRIEGIDSERKNIKTVGT